MNTDKRQTFSAGLRQAVRLKRESMKLTQDDLASELDIGGRGVIRNFEAGQTWPGDDVIDKLVEFAYGPASEMAELFRSAAIAMDGRPKSFDDLLDTLVDHMDVISSAFERITSNRPKGNENN